MNCIKVVTTSAEYCAGALQLTIPDTVLHHGTRLRICIAQKPTGTPTENDNVTIKDGRGTFNVVHCRACNCPGVQTKLYASQLQHTQCGELRVRQYIDVVYSADCMELSYVGPCRSLRPVSCSAFPVFDPVVTKKEAVKK